MPVEGQGPVGAGTGRQLGAHLCVHNVGQVERLLHVDMKDSPRLVDTNVCAMASRRSGRKAWIKGRAVDGLPNGSWNEAGRRAGDSTGPETGLGVRRRPPQQTPPRDQDAPLSSLPENRQHPTSPQHPLGKLRQDLHPGPSVGDGWPTDSE